MKTVKYILIVILAAGISWVICTYKSGSTAKTGFIKNGDLYNDFELKKELETKLLKVKNQRKSILDSLMIPLQLLSGQVQKSQGKDEAALFKFKQEREMYLSKQKEFDDDNQRLAEEYSQQIWKQLNQYIEDYGKANDYEYIYGATGDGAIMYAKEKNDLTKEISAYVNERYKGNK